MIREDFSYSSDSDGYKIIYKGISIGGAGIEGHGETLTVRVANRQSELYAELAKLDINDILKGKGAERYMSAIRRVNNQLIK